MVCRDRVLSVEVMYLSLCRVLERLSRGCSDGAMFVRVPDCMNLELKRGEMLVNANATFQATGNW